jgi:hypothetical protein
LADNLSCDMQFGMPKLIDLTAQRFGRLVVIERAKTDKLKPQWLCACDCGNTSVAFGSDLKLGRHQSCGCLQKERTAQAQTTHGKSRSRAHTIWSHIKYRCTNPRCASWDIYGGRGIGICGRWMKFENFYADMGDPPEGHSIDRINVNGNYEPSNCRWATPTEQNSNTRRTRRYVFDGRALTPTELAAALGTSRTYAYKVAKSLPRAN